VLEFRILGPVEVIEQGQPLRLGGPRQRALLAILVLRRGEVVTSDRLIDQLWGERSPATAAKTLQGYISHLRKALGDGVLLTQGGGYVLAVEPGQVDSERFDALVGEGREALATGDAVSARELLRSALELWRGEPLADLAYEPFAQADVARLEEARNSAIEDRAEAELQLGRHRELVAELEVLSAANPYRERLLGQLMLALYRCGRQADALAAYRRGRDRLDDELGLEPGPELRALEQRILSHDPSLEAPSTARLGKRARRGNGRVLMIAGGGLLLAAAIAAAIVALVGGGGTSLRVPPNSVAAIAVGNDRVTAEVGVGLRPGALAYGSGSLWVANLDDQTISRVDPTTLRTLRTIPVSDPPTGIATAGAAVWVADSDPTNTFVSVSRIDPQFDAIDSSRRLGNVVPGTPATVAAAGNRLWVAPASGDVTSLDATTGRVVQQIDPNSGPAGIGVGAGAVWVTDAGADNVTRVDPTGLLTPIAVGHGPSGVAVGDGGVWVADSGDNAVVRIDPVTRAVTATIPVGAAPIGVSVGAGSVWVANSGDGTVTRLNPGTNKAIATIPVGGSPQAIAIVGHRAWVTVDALTVPAGPRPLTGGVARLDSPYDVDYMDPALAYSPLSWQLLYASCAKLLNYPDKPSPAGSQLIPEVAESLPAVSDGGRTYTFRLRSGFRFSPPSNQPVTAQTFKYSIERLGDPRMKSPVAYELSDIVGAQAFEAGKAAQITGIVAQGDTLTIHLLAPAPDLLARVADPNFCPVPTDTPINPGGVRVIPSAGPYRVASYTPGQGVVLTRNPNYAGSRPRRLARIELRVKIPGPTAIAQIKAGRADYAVDGEVDRSDVAALAARYGPGSPAAKKGRQQYFVNAGTGVSFFALNSHRPLFADARVRLAVNYAVDRIALAQIGSYGEVLPEQPTDHYLPAEMPGYRPVRNYPLTADVVQARRLASGRTGATAVLYTCNVSPCDQLAHVLSTELAAIGLHVDIKTFPFSTLYAKLATPAEPFDIATLDWAPDYIDPDAMLNVLLEGGKVLPTFDDSVYRARLAAAARLAGPARYLAYAKLDSDLARSAAPWVPYISEADHDFFSSRVGCQIHGVYGMDLAALCLRK
jgi:YVTN family beta-propeller protein